MYEELLKVLRTCSKRDSCFWLGDTCPYMGNRLCDDKAGKAADAIEDLDNRLNLHRQGKIGHWIPVTERLPERNGFYLCLYKHKHPGGVAMDEGLSIVQMYKGKWNLNDIYAVTHWMPLPEPPKADKDGAE